MPSAAILAGGRASRFGGLDKGALVVGGRTIRERQLALLSGLTDDILLVRDAPPSEPTTWPIREIVDRVPGLGPLGGLQAALVAARDDRLIVLAGDMPWVSAPLLRHLVALAEDADLVVPRTERGYHPLCAVYARAALPAVERRLAAGSRALRDLLEDLRTRVVEGAELRAFGDPDRLLTNVNTPADYERINGHETHEL